MYLGESLSSEYGRPYGTELPPPTDFRWLSALAQGWSLATGRSLAVSCRGPDMRIHDLHANRRSPKIGRSDWTAESLTRCFRFHVGHMEHWEDESDAWGPDPFGGPHD